jgi:hypothetical protein
MDPSRLAKMLTAHGAERWRPEEMGSILRHQLSVRLEFDLAGIASDDDAPPAAPEGARMRPATFGELLHHPRPPVAMLRRVKLFAKACKAKAEGPLPPEVATVLYFASIVVALLRCETRITELDDDGLLKGAQWALAQTWLDQSMRSLFEEATAKLMPTT